ncbi:MAG: acyl carrier protein [bacterium]
MNELSREAIFGSISQIISSLKDEWEYSGTITPETFLFSELEFESIDAVVLGSMIEEHFKRSFPFAEYLANLGEQEIRDIRVKDLIDFVYKNLETQHENL